MIRQIEMSEEMNQIAHAENNKSSSVYIFSSGMRVPSINSSNVNSPTFTTSGMPCFKDITEFDRDENTDLSKRRRRSINIRTHKRSASHGGVLATSSTGWQSNLEGPLENYSTSSIVTPRASALKKPGHQRALSHGQVSNINPIQPMIVGHNRIGSRTDFILPLGHREEPPRPLIGVGGTAKTPSFRGHSRQASRSESIYTIRRGTTPSFWRRVISRCFGKELPEEMRFRTIVPNHLVPPQLSLKNHPNGLRINNRVRTTKYTTLTFLPRNLMEQFHRIANLYFIFIVLLNWVPDINAFGKEIAMIPVVFVLGVTALKDFFEDKRRLASDRRVNNSLCRVYISKADGYTDVAWKDIKVGDLVHLSNNEVVPADILLLRSSDPQGLAFLDTCNLDGETNLKQRQVIRGFLDHQNSFEPSKFRSIIEVDRPTTKMYRFYGAVVHPNGSRVPITTENLLLRECLLKNTDSVEGIVIYAGHDTKAMLNNGGPRYKRSRLERQMNLDIIWCVVILVILCIVGAAGCKFWLSSFSSDTWVPFLPTYQDSSYEGMITFWTFIIILQVMIPLSLYVTMEMAKVGQIYHIAHDIALFDENTEQRAECRALNITEELGQIQYIFSDKTGTLTENKMIFRRCTVGGQDYIHNGEDENILPCMRLKEDLLISSMRHRLEELFILLAICNTVVVNSSGYNTKLDAAAVTEESPKNVNNIIKLKKLFELHNILSPKSLSSPLSPLSSIPTSSLPLTLSPISPSLLISPPSSLSSYMISRILFNRNKTVYQNDNDVLPSSSAISVMEVPLSSAEIKIVQKKKFKPQILDISTLLNVKIPMKNAYKNHRRTYNSNIDKAIKTININSTTSDNNNHTNLDDNNDDDDDDDDDDYDNNSVVANFNNENTNNIEIDTLCLTYEAESPDELALVHAAKSYNINLIKRTSQNVTISLPDKSILIFEILHVLPFDSNRKCMSIVVRHPHTNEIILYTKGADSTLLPCINTTDEDNATSVIKIRQQLYTYSRQGLRTLAMAKRVLAQTDFDVWKQRYMETQLANDNRDRKLRECYAILESHLTLLGATGIEDKLQEGVPETITALMNAGIVIWILTGDKPETAVNIAYSAKLFTPSMQLLRLQARSKSITESLIHGFLESIRLEVTVRDSDNITFEDSRNERREGVIQRALVVDGKTLTFILDARSGLITPFLQLAQNCSSVLACRATPLQKAYIVKIVKEKLHLRTLAIGDGANDVSMIQTADVGIGVSGREGTQAVMASDFAIARFPMLTRLLLVHGHLCYDRLARMILYFFYKNAMFVFLIFWYQLYCGFSGAVMIDQMYLMLYNLLFTSLPPLAIGIYDRIASPHILISHPQLYTRGRLGNVYKHHSFWITIADALYQSIVIFFVTEAAYHDSDIDIWEFGTTITTSCIVVMLIHVGLEIKSWTIIHGGAIFVSLGTFFGFCILYNIVCVNCMGLPGSYWVMVIAITRHCYWFTILLTSVLALLPRLLYKTIKNTLYPDMLQRMKFKSDIKHELTTITTTTTTTTTTTVATATAPQAQHGEVDLNLISENRLF